MGFDLVVDVAFLHPAIGKTIFERPDQTVGQIVFGFAGDAGEVSHGDLFHAAVLQVDQGREETVHSREERDAFGVLRAENLEGATRVLHPVVSHHPAESVGNFGGYVFHETILSAGSNAHDHLELIGVVEQKIEVCWCGLQIGIDVSAFKQ